ncbi:MAG TPA: hypothetical protein VGS20_04280 [Candidatus Acidoferrales bacterium]|nr:hypothetical protein [Candidatus Acidoferrales bacterium]
MIGRIISLPALLVWLAAAPALGARSQARPAAPASRPKSAAATLTFRKVFKSSTPEFIEIKLDESGAGTYDIRQLADPPTPLPFQASAPLAARLFSLAAALHDFDGVQLDVRRHIANLGVKTFRYEKAGETHEVTFNYTTKQTANELLEDFEGLALELQYADQLKRSMRYDPLGLNDILLRLQSDLSQKLLADPESLAPLLDQIASNPRFLDIARQRARALALSLGSPR